MTTIIGKSLYDVLEVSRVASADVINASYQKLLEKLDPEMPGNPRDDAAVLRFRALREAFITLSNPDRRKQYDARLRALETVETVEPFWTGARIFVLLACFALAGGAYWKHRATEAKLELERIAVEKERVSKIEAEKQRIEDERAAVTEAGIKRAQEARMQSELEYARRYGDAVSQRNESERSNYERQLQYEQQREQAASQRQRQIDQMDSRRRAADDQRRLQQLEYDRLRGR
ncbi:MAG: hypothetical protein JWN94_1324 [Betaproteobacteria bacterium]|nr:hypothetical protein [Betaproteobacteria bacterium]